MTQPPSMPYAVDMDSFLEQMQAHRAQAAAERERIDARIRALDVLIGQESGEVAATSLSRASDYTVYTFTEAPMPLTLADAVTKALEEIGRAIDFQGLSSAVRRIQSADVNEKSLRGTLPRMEREGRIVRPQRGYYALPTNAENPALTGLSVVLNPATATQEGGGASGTGAHRVRDDSPVRQTDHLAHAFGAPIEGA